MEGGGGVVVGVGGGGVGIVKSRYRRKSGLKRLNNGRLCVVKEKRK